MSKIDEATYGWFTKRGDTTAHLMRCGGRMEHGFPAECGELMGAFRCVEAWPKKLPDEDLYTICTTCLSALTFDRMIG